MLIGTKFFDSCPNPDVEVTVKIEVRYAAPGVFELELTTESDDDEIVALLNESPNEKGEANARKVRVPLYQSEVGALLAASQEAVYGS